MDTTEIIHNALEWANKRLKLQGEPITENQRNYIVFALRQQLTIPAVVGRSEQLVCDCGNKITDKELYFGQCLQCDKNIEEAN